MTVDQDIDLLQMDLHAVTLMSVLRIHMAVIIAAPIQREATIVPAALDTVWSMMIIIVGVSPKMHALNGTSQ